MTATGDGTLYFTDSGDLRELSAAGQIRTLARNLAAGAGSVPRGQEWRLVMGLWTDAARNVYVAVYGLREVKRVSPDGRVEVVARSRFPWAPTGGLIAPNGDLWLLESTFTNAVRARRIENVVRRTRANRQRGRARPH
jgi:sugar lactone lactonase YvrE